MRDELNAKGVVYNFDGAVSGKGFGPHLLNIKKLLVEASKDVEYPYTDQTLFEFWNKNNQEEPPIEI